jgi:hypothetical protein
LIQFLLLFFFFLLFFPLFLNLSTNFPLFFFQNILISLIDRKC